MAKKVSVSLLLLAAFFGFCYGVTAICAPQNLKALCQIDRATLFSALRAGKMFLLGIPHWCWVTLGVLSILSVIPIWALCAIAKIDEFARVPPAPEKPALGEESWRKIWEKPSTPSINSVPPTFKWDLNTGHDVDIMPDKPTPAWLTLKIRCREKSFIKNCGLTLFTDCAGTVEKRNRSFNR